MKRFFMMTLFFLGGLQVQADAYNCVDKVTGQAAGKFEHHAEDINGNETILYSHTQATSEGWILRVANNGNLYNGDPMVQHGKDVLVGKIETKAFYFLLDIHGRKFICD